MRTKKQKKKNNDKMNRRRVRCSPRHEQHFEAGRGSIHAACAERNKKEERKSSARNSSSSGGSWTNKKRNDNEKQTLKIGFFICIGKSNQANVKTSTRHMHNIKPAQRHPDRTGQAVQVSSDVRLPTADRCTPCHVTYTPGAGMEHGASDEEACIKRTINESCAPHVWPYS